MTGRTALEIAGEKADDDLEAANTVTPLVSNDDANVFWNHQHGPFGRSHHRCLGHNQPSSTEETHEEYRTNLFEIDVKLHVLLCIVSTTGLVLAVALKGPSAWIVACANTMAYAFAYVIMYTRPKYTPGLAATEYVMWWTALVVLWLAQLPKGFSKQTSSVIQIDAVFSWISFVICLCIPIGYYQRHQIDSDYINQYRSISSSPPSPVSTARLSTLLLTSPSSAAGLSWSPADYMITGVSWWQERDIWKHQYIVVRAVPACAPSQDVFVRVERVKWIWRASSPHDQPVSASKTLLSVTSNSTAIAQFAIEVDHAERIGFNLRLLGTLTEILDEQSPRFVLPNLTCWWFAACCFQTLAQMVVPPGSESPRLAAFMFLSIWSRKKLTPAKLRTFGRVVYVVEHFGYWGLLFWISYSIPNAFGKGGLLVDVGFVGCTMASVVCYVVVMGWAWKRARRKFSSISQEAPPPFTLDTRRPAFSISTEIRQLIQSHFRVRGWWLD